jgi:predicted nucleotidyltransferase
MGDFDELRALLEGTPEVGAAWVFGSVARREEREDSDLDVAVLLVDPRANALTHRRALADLAPRERCRSPRRSRRARSA